MAHRHDINHLIVVKHVVNHAIVPNANAPKVLKALDFATTTWAWILSQCLYPGEYTSNDTGAETLEFLSG